MRKGSIAKIIDDVAWGELDDGMTFDLPAKLEVLTEDGRFTITMHIGDEVWYSDAASYEDDEIDNAGYSISILQANQAFVLSCFKTMDGYEITNVTTLKKFH